MCGIYGFAGFPDQNLLRQMGRVLRHRGPDQQGEYSDKSISMGCQRLSIVDISGGKQPIFNEDRSIAVVNNGEIYNHGLLRAQLEQRGHRFCTESDTEVIVHAYEEYGTECISLLNGMFAFALWDSARKTLLLARDRIGIKPLFYWSSGGKLVFASEIKAILQCPDVCRKVNLAGMSQLLCNRHVQGKDTLFEQVYRVLPGHCMAFCRGRIAIMEYPKEKPCHGGRGFRDLSRQICGLLSNSVRMRMMADVPVGAMISGGLDSTAVLAMMDSENIKTFSVGFHEDRIDDLKYARMASDHYGTDHHEIIAEPAHIRKLPGMIWHLDDLVTDPVVIPNHILSELAGKHVKVVLSGEGADEIFAGYAHHQDLHYGRFIGRILPRPALRVMSGLAGMTPPGLLGPFFRYPAELGFTGRERAARILASLKNPARCYLYHTSIFTPDEASQILGKAYRPQKAAPIKGLDSVLLHESRTWLPNYILSKYDSLTMANSVEGRVPFLDRDLMSACMEIPARYKVRLGREKHILRQALRSYVPKEILLRKKQPYFMPLNGHYLTSLRELFADVFSNPEVRKRPYYRPRQIEKIASSGEFIRTKQLFSLLSLELWFRTYIDRDKCSIPLKAI
ncbi:MAG: asparagine synthase (glutamine-hydrolyzing) [archaeon]